MRVNTSKILFFFLIVVSKSLFAQSYYYKNYSTNEGLPSPECYQALQDRKGYIWICTDNGISKFDGYKFCNFGAKEGLKEAAIMEIQEDDFGKIWARSLSGRIFKINNDTVTPYKYNNIIDRYNTPLSFHFHYDAIEKKMYIELKLKGFLIINNKGKAQLLKPHPATRLFGIQLKNELIYTQVEPQYSAEILEIRTKSDISLPFFIPGHNANHHTVGKSPPIIKRINNHLLLFQSNHQTGIIQNNILLCSRQIKGKEIANSVLVENDGSFFVANLNKGGWRHYKNKHAFINNDYTQLIDNITITSSIKDNMGGYWVTSLEESLFYFPNLNVKIYNQTTGLPEDIIPAMVIKSKNKILLSSISGTIGVLNTQTNKFKKITSTLGRCYDILSINDSTFWYASSDNLILFENKKPYFVSQTSKKLYRSSVKKETWVLSRYGAKKVSAKKQKVIMNTANLIDSKFKRTFSILEDSEQNLWIANMQGLSLLKNNQLISKSYLHPFFSSRIEEMVETSDGTMIFGIKGAGIVFWKNNLITQISEKDGLSSSMIEKIHIDKYDNIWIGTPNGLNKVWKENGIWKIQQFTKNQGLPSNEIWEILTIDNEVWCATSKGIARFTPTAKKIYSKRPRILNTLVNNHKKEHYTNLKYSENNIDIWYVSLNYAMGGKILYRYRISSKHNWTYTYSTQVHFSSLKPGRYTFELQSQNTDAYWSYSTTFAFRISTPWWSTWWFMLMSLSFLGAVTYLIYNDRLTLLKREIKLQQEIRDVEKTALIAQMNPHFLFNILNSIQNMILTNKKRKATVYLAKFADLIRLTLNASSKKHISLYDEINYLNNYLELEQSRLGKKLAFEILYPKNIQLDELMIPPLLIQPLIENALIHGVSTIESGFISIEYLLKTNTLFISVSDNGVGIKRISNTKPKHNSYGISLVQKRLSLLNADKLTVEEIFDDYGQCLGTKARYSVEIDAPRPVIK